MKKKGIFLVFIVLNILFFPLASSDYISVNSGGEGEIIIGYGSSTEGFFSGEPVAACAPTTCAALGYNCNTWDDGCGGTLNCGSCSSGFTCSSGVCTAEDGGDGGDGGGGGGGGGAVLKKELTDIRVIPEDFHLSVGSESISFGKISVISLTDSEIDLSVSLTNSLRNIISFEENSFTLGARETKTLNFQITAPINGNVHAGKMIFTSGGKTLEVPFALNVREGLSLFDISVDIAEENRIINPGEILAGQVTLIQAGVKESVDVQINYIVKDFENNIYSEESETIMVFDQKTYEHTFDTGNLALGDYIVGVEVIYSGGVATASSPFQVVEEGVTRTAQLTYVILLSILTIGIVVLLLLLRYYRRKIKVSLRRKIAK